MGSKLGANRPEPGQGHREGRGRGSSGSGTLIAGYEGVRLLANQAADCTRPHQFECTEGRETQKVAQVTRTGIEVPAQPALA